MKNYVHPLTEEKINAEHPLREDDFVIIKIPVEVYYKELSEDRQDKKVSKEDEEEDTQYWNGHKNFIAALMEEDLKRLEKITIRKK
jgi:hypothetical protein